MVASPNNGANWNAQTVYPFTFTSQKLASSQPRIAPNATERIALTVAVAQQIDKLKSRFLANDPGVG